MNTHLELEKAIRDRMPGYAWGPFPAADIKKICPNNTMDLHTAFDLYFAEIAGYSVSVKALRRKPPTDLRQVKDRLSASFFERYSEFDEHRTSITPENTPNLYRNLVTVEENRVDLVRLIDSILDSGHEAGGGEDSREHSS